MSDVGELLFFKCTRARILPFLREVVSRRLDTGVTQAWARTHGSSLVSTNHQDQYAFGAVLRSRPTYVYSDGWARVFRNNLRCSPKIRCRIQSQINNSEMVPLRGGPNAAQVGRNRCRRMPSDMKLQGVSIVFNRSAEQQAALEKLLAAQQDPASPQYHRG